MKNYNDIYDKKQKMCTLMDEAYSKGYAEAGGDCEIAIKESYQKGLYDGWKCAQKVQQMLFADRTEIFGTETLGDILDSYSASEAITKIKEYEEKKEAEDKEIKVGDEVVNDAGFIAIVTRVHRNDDFVAIMYTDGSCDNSKRRDGLTKTGKHYDIQSILDTMSDEQ